MLRLTRLGFNPQLTGKFGESFARRYLEAKHYTIWHTNWRCRAGEIDIIAAKNRQLVFIEVKTRNHFETLKLDPIDAVDTTKRDKLERLGRWYRRSMSRRIKRAGIRDFRFDIIGITLATKPQAHLKPRLTHLQDVFSHN